MSRVVCKTVYRFNELSDKAKKKALDRHRDWFVQDQWYCNVYTDAVRLARLMGIAINDREYKTVGGGKGYEPCIYFSGFSSQGDGACFEGSYSYAKSCVKAIESTSPQDKELLRIVNGLYEIQKRNRYKVSVTVVQRGHYNHSGCTEFDFEDGCINPNDNDDLKRLLRDFMDWIYGQLEDEYSYLTGDECLMEMLGEGDHEFNKDGTPA